MSLTLHFHPLSTFCQKVLVGLYELGVAFTPHQVDLGDPAQRAALLQLWPMGKFPVLRDEARGVTVPESSIVLEYAERYARDGARLVPEGLEAARECRLRDRFFDSYLQLPMQKIVGDKLRPEGSRDPFGVEHARGQLEMAYGVADEWTRQGPWAMGDAFTLADCAAAPALFFAGKVLPFGDRHRHLAAYYARLCERPSVARTFAEAKPFMTMFPG